MWQNRITQHNVKKLIDFGIKIIPPEEGELSSGLRGDGRLASIENIIKYIDSFLADNSFKEKNAFNKSKVIEVTQEQHEKKDNNAFNIKQAIEQPIYSINDAVEKDKWSTELEYTKLKDSTKSDKKKIV